MNETIMTAMN